MPMQNSWRCWTGDVSNKKIILIDDVYATGSTMEEVARKLKESKASVVWGVTVAREIS